MPAAVAACKGVLDDCGLLPTVTTQWYGYSGHHDLDVFIELGRWKRGALLCVDWAASGGLWRNAGCNMQRACQGFIRMG